MGPPPTRKRGDAARQAGPACLPHSRPQGSRGWPLWAEPRTPNQDVLTSPAPGQGRPASSLLPHVRPLNAIWAFQSPVSSTSPCPRHPPTPTPPLAPSGSLPQRGQWVHQLHRTPRSPAAPCARQVGFSPHTGWGLGPGAPVAVGLEQSVTSKHPAWMVGAARVSAPSPVGCSWSFPGAGEDGVGRGGGALVPAQGRTRRVPTHSPQSGCRVASSGFSQSPSQSGRRGLCPSSPAPCQRVSQPRAG